GRGGDSRGPCVVALRPRSGPACPCRGGGPVLSLFPQTATEPRASRCRGIRGGSGGANRSARVPGAGGFYVAAAEPASRGPGDRGHTSEQADEASKDTDRLAEAAGEHLLCAVRPFTALVGTLRNRRR